MKVRLLKGGLLLAALGTLTGIAAQAATPDLADVRLGVHEGAITRVVLDLRGGGAPFSYSISDDGMTLIVALRAEGHSPALPRRGTGLVRAVEAAPVTNGTRISIAASTPISVVQTGILGPERGYRFHRIYFDLGPATSAPATPGPMPIPESHPAVVAAASASVTETTPEQASPASEGHEGHEMRESQSEESALTIKVGGVFERSVSDYSNSYGPTAALQTGMLFHDALEMELGTTALLKDSRTTWKTGLIFKKPIELSENTELAFGAGPIWLHRSHLDDDAAADSAGAEGVLEMVVWPGEHHSLGFYAETGYSYDFGKGHEKAAGAGAGVLVPLP